MISTSLIANLTPAAASANPWASVMPALAETAPIPADSFQANPEHFAAPVLASASNSPFLEMPDAGVILSDKQTVAAEKTALAATPGLPPGLKVLLLGAESSAKEEYADQLSSQHNLPHLHMRDLIKSEIQSKSDLGQALADRRLQGDNSPGELINQLLEKRLGDHKDSQGFILDAFPSDLAKADLKKLLGDKQQVRVIELGPGNRDGSPSLPCLADAEKEGQYYQVDDDGDKDQTADVLDALMENFTTPDMGWLKR